MRYLEESNPNDVSLCAAIEKGIRNAWKWYWLQDACDKSISYSKWCRKIDEAGKCFCIPCGKVLNYASSGKKALKSHSANADHALKMSSYSSNYKLSNDLEGSVTMSDKACELKAILSLFMAQHCLPFSLSQPLIDLAQQLSKDPKALNSLSMNRTAATYTMTHGVGHAIKEKLSADLQGKILSLNIDEATNNNGTKYLNVICNHYNEEEQRCIPQLLGVREVNISTSANITSAVISVLEERALDMGNVASVLMDNCNVMRGRKNGVEAKLREINPNMLDINGDTVHILNNATKRFFAPIEEFVPLQKVGNDIYVDIEESPKAKEIFDCIQNALYGKCRTALRPIGNRFNQMLAVSNRLEEIWDALVVYYSAFLNENDRRKYRGMINQIMAKHQVSAENKCIIDSHLRRQNEQAKSNTNCDRKDRIVHLLFDKNALALVIINLYKGVLIKFEKFIKLFQSAKPLVHLLHVELFGILKDFFSFFIQPQHIPMHDAKKLMALNYADPDLHLKRTSFFLGEFCKPLVLHCMKDKKSNPWLDEFFSVMKKAYLACAVGMLKLPVNNEVITELSCLSPGLQRAASTGPCLLKLAGRLPHVISVDDMGKLDEEVKAYSVDGDISLMEVDEEDKDFRLDVSYWTEIFKLKFKGNCRYPLLSRLVKAVISIFCGPLVESSFNVMDDIMRKDRSKLSVFNYEALAIIKSELMSKKKNATTMIISPKMKTAVATAYSRYSSHTQDQLSTGGTSAVTESPKLSASTLKPACTPKPPACAPKPLTSAPQPPACAHKAPASAPTPPACVPKPPDSAPTPPACASKPPASAHTSPACPPEPIACASEPPASAPTPPACVPKPSASASKPPDSTVGECVKGVLSKKRNQPSISSFFAKKQKSE